MWEGHREVTSLSKDRLVLVTHYLIDGGTQAAEYQRIESDEDIVE